MPHKKNPIISERIAGMARIVRAQVVPVMEGIPLWHERDISHSSTERIALPDASIATDYILNITLRLVDGLVVNKDRMLANLESTGGLIYSSSVLLELVEMGFSREDSYAIAQSAAMDTWNSGVPYRETLRKHAADLGLGGLELDEARLDAVCRPERYLERLDGVFERVAALT
jgi:adenylosuccinate lyase